MVRSTTSKTAQFGLSDVGTSVDGAVPSSKPPPGLAAPPGLATTGSAEQPKESLEDFIADLPGTPEAGGGVAAGGAAAAEAKADDAKAAE